MSIEGRTNNQRVGLKEIAERAGVTAVTVGKVLLGTGKNIRVGAATAERIRLIATELEYHPNIMAQQLAGKRSRLIGALIDSYAPEIFFERISEMERLAANFQYRFMVGQIHEEIDRIKAYALDFDARGVEGVICLSHNYDNAGMAKQVVRSLSRIQNLVFVGKPAVDDLLHPYVTVDTADGIHQAVDHLVSHGRKRISLLLIESRAQTVRTRYRSYIEAIEKHHLGFGENLVRTLGRDTKSSIEHLRSKLPELLKTGKPDAIIALNDRMAFMVISLLTNYGVKVPDDIAVVGYDNLDIAPYVIPPLTTVDQNSKELSAKTIEILMKLIEGRKLRQEERKIVIKPKLVVRESA
jgi:DNA-binding LacI/PurR family transcriptional regulator